MVQAVKAVDKKKETTGADIKKTGQPDYKLLIDTAALAGTIMLENGAEIYRVVSTGIMISLDDPSIDALTVIRRVNKGATNLNVIAQVNDISRKFYMRIISLEEAFSQLKHLKKSQYPWWLKDICTVFVVAFFAGMYGGDFKDMAATAIVGIFLASWLHIGKKIALNPLINDLVASIVISVIATLHGDYASGNANILQAFTEAAMIALGVYVGLLLL